MNSTEKKLRDYMKLPYTVMLRRDEEGDFIARIKELEGCVADGQDEMEALGNIEKVKELWLGAALKANKEIPLPDEDASLPSGKFLTRVPRTLHKSLIDIAQQEGVSLNQLVTVALAELAGRKAAVPAQVFELKATSRGYSVSESYGVSKSAPRLRLVNPSTLKMPNNETESLLTEVLSGQLRESSEFKPRKEA